MKQETCTPKAKAGGEANAGSAKQEPSADGEQLGADQGAGLKDKGDEQGGGHGEQAHGLAPAAFHDDTEEVPPPPAV